MSYGIVSVEVPKNTERDFEEQLTWNIERVGKNFEKAKYLGLYLVDTHDNPQASFVSDITKNGVLKVVKEIKNIYPSVPYGFDSENNGKFATIYFMSTMYEWKLYVFPLKTKKAMDEFKKTPSCDIEYYYIKEQPRLSGMKTVVPKINIRRMF